MPARTEQDLSAVWGSSAKDVYATGARGSILHYDGSDWSSLGAGFTERLGGMRAASSSLGGICGASSVNVFAVGGYESTEIESGGSSYYGVVARYDGSRWAETHIMPCRIPCELFSVWCASDKDVFAVGAYSTIIHYDGEKWTAMNAGQKAAQLNGVWGSSGKDVYSVGSHGIILHYDGTGWKQVRSAGKALSAIWGSSPTDIFAVGKDGTILHYDGSTWTEHGVRPG
jgi:hypothetical protein